MSQPVKGPTLGRRNRLVTGFTLPPSTIAGITVLQEALQCRTRSEVIRYLVAEAMRKVNIPPADMDRALARAERIKQTYHRTRKQTARKLP